MRVLALRNAVGGFRRSVTDRPLEVTAPPRLSFEASDASELSAFDETRVSFLSASDAFFGKKAPRETPSRARVSALPNEVVSDTENAVFLCSSTWEEEDASDASDASDATRVPSRVPSRFAAASAASKARS